LLCNHLPGNGCARPAYPLSEPVNIKVTTDSNHKVNIAPNLLDQDFSANAPNQKWAGDISYIWTGEGWLYLPVILDLHSRHVIGWAPLGTLRAAMPCRQWSATV